SFESSPLERARPYHAGFEIAIAERNGQRRSTCEHRLPLTRLTANLLGGVLAKPVTPVPNLLEHTSLPLGDDLERQRACARDLRSRSCLKRDQRGTRIPSGGH